MEIANSVLYLVALVIIGALAFYGLYLGQYDIGSAAVNGLLGFVGGVGVGAAGALVVKNSTSA